MTHKVFVYGTLKRGKKNHHFLREAHFIGEARTSSELSLYFSEFPCLIEEGSTDGVSGEIYEVSEKVLAALDELEEHPHWYVRQERLVLMGGEAVKAWMYLLPKKFLGPEAYRISCGIFE